MRGNRGLFEEGFRKVQGLFEQMIVAAAFHGYRRGRKDAVAKVLQALEDDRHVEARVAIGRAYLTHGRPPQDLVETLIGEGKLPPDWVDPEAAEVLFKARVGSIRLEPGKGVTSITVEVIGGTLEIAAEELTDPADLRVGDLVSVAARVRPLTVVKPFPPDLVGE